MSDVRLRLMQERDVSGLLAWTKADPFHQDVPIDWMKEPRTQTFLVEDGEGPILAVRMSNAIRIEAQFNPEGFHSRRTKRGVILFSESMRSGIRSSGPYRELVCTPGSDELAQALESLGWREHRTLWLRP